MKGMLIGVLFALTSSAVAQTVAPHCGQFTPMVTEQWIGAPHRRVHFFPKICNKIMIAGKLETIPAATGVITGGVVGDVTNACIDKVCGQKLAPLTLYRVYVFMLYGAMKMDFSTVIHKEDPTYGNQVHAADPTRSLVGLVRTNENGWLNGGTKSLMTLSWFNRGHTGLADWIGWNGRPIAETCSPTLTVMKDYFVEFLVFGINDRFTQGYTVPNVYVSGTATNTAATGYAHVGIAIERNGQPPVHFSHIATVYKSVVGDAGSVHTASVGGFGTDEGYVKAYLMLGAPNGGCARMPNGSIYTSPHHS